MVETLPVSVAGEATLKSKLPSLQLCPVAFVHPLIRDELGITGSLGGAYLHKLDPISEVSRW